MKSFTMRREKSEEKKKFFFCVSRSLWFSALNNFELFPLCFFSFHFSVQFSQHKRKINNFGDIELPLLLLVFPYSCWLKRKSLAVFCIFLTISPFFSVDNFCKFSQIANFSLSLEKHHENLKLIFPFSHDTWRSTTWTFFTRKKNTLKGMRLRTVIKSTLHKLISIWSEKCIIY